MKRRHRWKYRPPKPKRSKKILILSLVGVTLAVCVVIVFAQQRARRVTREETNGQGTITVRRGGDFQKALEAAQPGDTIYLEAGASFEGPFTLPKKMGDAFITIRTSAPDSSLPPANERITPAYAGVLPKLVTTGKGEAALQTAPGAHHYRFIGIEIKPSDASALVYELVKLGENSKSQKTLAEAPHNLVFDRCYIHGDPAGSLKRGIALHSAQTEIINSYISDFKVKGQEAQAIWGANGPGPFKIVNNYLEGAGENILFGGEDPSIPNLVPSDIEIRRNHLAKPANWRGRFTVKNILELKNARRVVIDGNLLEYNWADAQEGVAVLFTVRNQDGTAPWSAVQDVTFTNNIVRHSGSAFSILGKDDNYPSQQTRKITIRNNVFDDISSPNWGGRGAFLLITGTADVVIEQNTVLQTGNITAAYGDPNTGFIFRNNVIVDNGYGFHGDGRTPGQDTLDFYFPGSIISNNAIIGGDASIYKGRNMYPASAKQLKFANPEGGDYRLRPDSPLKKAGTNGTDIGANIDPQTFTKS